MKQKSASVANCTSDSSVSVVNRQRTRPIDLPLLRRVVRHFLTARLALSHFDLAIHLVDAVEMTRLNETRLRHAGSTDVITFDYSTDGPMPTLAGEIFVCVDEALLQARRFNVPWQAELVRYIVHGVLHLQGYDDTRVAARRRMKAQENRRVRELTAEFDLRKLQRKSKVGL
jgi:probable rRNA maturation factor